MSDPKDDYSRDYKCECGHCLGHAYGTGPAVKAASDHEVSLRFLRERDEADERLRRLESLQRDTDAEMGHRIEKLRERIAALESEVAALKQPRKSADGDDRTNPRGGWEFL